MITGELAARRCRSLAIMLSAALVVTILDACGSGTGSSASSGPREPETVTVFAAASLTGAFTKLKSQFEATYSDVRVQLNFGSSSTLATQIINGAPADVFASADQANMSKVVDEGLIDGAAPVFARNSLAIIVEAGNPEHITGLADLNRPGLVVSMCAPNVPAGNYARQAFAKAGLPVPGAGGETNVEQVVTRVRLGEADAGVVYVTDIKAAGDKAGGVTIPPEQNVVASYPAGLVKDGPNAAGGRAFLDLLASDAGRAVLTDLGFQEP